MSVFFGSFRNPNFVDLDVERFMKEIESVMKPPNAEHAAAADDDVDDEDLSSDMDLGKFSGESTIHRYS